MMERILLRKPIEANEKKPLFQLFFLKHDKDQSVEVEELEEIDFAEIERRLEQGESVFITRTRKHKLRKSLVAGEDAAEPCYFTRI